MLQEGMFSEPAEKEIIKPTPSCLELIQFVLDYQSHLAQFEAFSEAAFRGLKTAEQLELRRLVLEGSDNSNFKVLNRVAEFYVAWKEKQGETEE